MKWQILLSALIVAIVQFAPLPAWSHNHWGGCGWGGGHYYHHHHWNNCGWGNGYGNMYRGYGGYGGYGGYPSFGGYNYGGYPGYGYGGAFGGISRFIRGF